MKHNRYLATHTRPKATEKGSEIYFGVQSQCLGRIQSWENYPTYGFPFQHRCEECGWDISYIDEMVMINAGTHGKNHYHKHCWDDKITDNRPYPKLCVRYGFDPSWDSIQRRWIKHVPIDAEWDKERETFVIKCKLCNSMIRATPYRNYEREYAKGHCGKCTRERVCQNDHVKRDT